MTKEDYVSFGVAKLLILNGFEFNNKYHTSLLEKDAIRELIDDNYLEVVDNHLRCNDKYLYTENSNNFMFLV